MNEKEKFIKIDNEKRVTKNIIDAYIKLRDTIGISEYKKFNVIILMHPKVFLELQAEFPFGIRRDKDIECYFVSIFGSEVPILIRRDIPEEMEFQMMTQQDYERLREKELYKELNTMFFN